MHFPHRASRVVHKGCKLPCCSGHLMWYVEVKEGDVLVGVVGLQQSLLAHLWHQSITQTCKKKIGIYLIFPYIHISWIYTWLWIATSRYISKYGYVLYLSSLYKNELFKWMPDIKSSIIIKWEFNYEKGSTIHCEQ